MTAVVTVNANHFHYKNTLLNFVLRQLEPLHNHAIHFLKANFSIIPPSVSRVNSIILQTKTLCSFVSTIPLLKKLPYREDYDRTRKAGKYYKLITHCLLLYTHITSCISWKARLDDHILFSGYDVHNTRKKSDMTE